MYSQKQKTKFRGSSKWKKFRQRLKKERKVDALTLKPLYPRFNLHHMDLNEDHYEDITDESRFLCLNQQSHEFLHWFMRYALSDPDIMKRLEEIIEEHKRINKMSLY